MRILFASPIGGLGGAELFLLEMLEELRSRVPDWELHLVTGGDGPLLERAAALGVICHLEPFPEALAKWGDTSAQSKSAAKSNFLIRGLRLAAGVLAYRRRFRTLLRRIDPDLIHSNGLKYHAITGLAGCGRAKLVWFLHDYLGSRRFLSRVLPRLGRSVRLLWANSRSVAEDIRQLMPRTPVEVLHCGIDLEKFSPGPSEAEWLDRQCEPPRDSGDVLRIGLVATYARWKGQDVFLKAAAEFHRRHPEPAIRFYIIGGPIYQTAGSQFSREELAGLAVELGIGSLVRFVPFQSEVARVYRSLDIVVHASRQVEPFGRTILEAMACGRAVVAVEAGGSAEIFAADRAAYGVPLDDASALAAALEALQDPAARRGFEDRARRRSVAFSRAHMGEGLWQQYRALLTSECSG